MFKKQGLILLLVMILFSASACNLTKENTNGYSDKNIDSNSGQLNPPTNGPNEDISKGDQDIEVDKTKEQISSMSLEEKIGQMLVVGIDGYNLNSNTKNLLDKHKVGGIIVMGENVQDSKQLLSLINEIKKENQKNKIPLFMTIDEEGGRVTRMPKEFKKLPSNKVIGQINNPTFSYKLGSVIAEEIKAFGFNMDFAPVLDINSNPRNLVIGDRAFGAKASIVSSLGIQTMKGIQNQNIIPAVKHFPGHGDTLVDSHKGLPSVSNDLKRLKSLELIPFSEAIKNNADVVMIAHILLPKIDKDNPSSMSKIIITDILRKELKFEGVVITDDMTMGAIVKNYPIGEAAVKSVSAGADIVLVCHGYNNEIEVINTLKNAVVKGEISEERIDESVYRILKLKEKYQLKDEIINTVDVNKINSKINNLLNSYVNKK